MSMPIRFMRYEEEPLVMKGLRWLCEYLARELPRPRIMYEIGSYAGESAEVFARYFDEVHCVDPWTGLAPEVEQSFDMRAAESSYMIKHKTTSLEAASNVSDSSLGFVYIDALHDYASVKDDIEAWWPKVSDQGFIGGHDFCYQQPGVTRAVTEAFGNVIQMNAKDIFTHRAPGAIMLFPDDSWLVRVE